jgi:tRNA modification GTPase
VLHVFNKADLVATAPPAGIALSARTGLGLDTLRHVLLAQAGWVAAPEGLVIARTRHVQALRRAREHLLQGQALAAQRDGALDLLAEELRLAHRALGEITGEFSSEDLLGEIFTRFCIGK